jgi:hypothetical protein
LRTSAFIAAGRRRLNWYISVVSRTFFARTMRYAVAAGNLFRRVRATGSVPGRDTT